MTAEHFTCFIHQCISNAREGSSSINVCEQMHENALHATCSKLLSQLQARESVITTEAVTHADSVTKRRVCIPGTQGKLTKWSLTGTPTWQTFPPGNFEEYLPDVSTMTPSAL